jgi:O-antigen ligase
LAELAAIGLTLFRAAWIAALIILTVSVGFRYRRWGQGLLVICVLSLVAYGAYVSGLRTNQTLSARVTNTANIEGRLAAYLDGVHIFQTAPLFGVGVGRFVDAQVAESASSSADTAYSVGGVAAAYSGHSSYVTALAELGLFGFIPLLALTLAAGGLIRSLRQCARSRSDLLLATTMLGAALAYLTMSLTLTILPFGPPNAFLAVLLGVGAGRLSALWDEPDRMRPALSPTGAAAGR